MVFDQDILLQRLQYWEAKVALRDELIDIVEQALSLIPTGQMQQGYQWIPSDEALVLLKRAKDRLTEFKLMEQM